MSRWRQARAIGLLPGNVTVVVPALILLLVDAPRIGWGFAEPGAALVALLGLVLICAGFATWLWTVTLFHRLGRGTLAPWDPTATLVVEGPYRHVRNPMITAVGTLLLGEAVFFGSLWILAWAGLFLLVNAVYFPLGEEPGLERRFGAEYRAYKRAVPRWIPRRHPWRPDQPTQNEAP